MFEQNEEIQSAIDMVYQAFRGLKRGDVLSHERLMVILNLAPHEGSWDHIVNRARRRLEANEGISTLASTNLGYKLLTPAEQLEEGPRRIRRSIRQIRRGRKSVARLPVRLLSIHQRRIKQFLDDKLKAAETAARRELADQNAIITPSKVIPRRKPQETLPAITAFCLIGLLAMICIARSV